MATRFTTYQRPTSSAKRWPIFVIIIVLILAGYSYYALSRPLPGIRPVLSTVQLHIGTNGSQLQWPTTGQSAVAVTGTAILNVHGKQSAVPIASVAKVITALVVLQKKPLALGSGGPSLTLTDQDVTLYHSYVAQLGSVVPVSVGEQITEYQALEALMLPSANNLADSLAIWAFGSLSNYKAAAEQYVSGLGLKNTHIGADASGFSATSTSTAHDLAIIGNQAMQNAVLRQIVAKTNTTDIPGVGSSDNVNFLLGTNNIVGIKTGNTEQAGGVYLSASTTQVNGKPVTIVTALVGAPTLFQALQNSLPLIVSAQTNFGTVDILPQQAIVGRYQLPWGGTLTATTQIPLTSQAWRGSSLTANVKLTPIDTTAHVGQVVGTVSTPATPFAPANQINVILEQAPTKPSVWWRLLHPSI